MRRRHDLIGTHVGESLQSRIERARGLLERTSSHRPGESSLRSWFIPATWPQSVPSRAVREK
jgi:hypothetical protein